MRKLYKLHLSRQEFYVVAKHSTEAIEALTKVIQAEGMECKVLRIDIIHCLICDEIRDQDRPFHLNPGRELLVVP